MTVGYADPAELDEQCREALVIAADALRVDLAREACRLKHGDVLEPESTMAEHLPSKHRLRYTREFAFDFLGALSMVRAGAPFVDRGRRTDSVCESCAVRP